MSYFDQFKRLTAQLEDRDIEPPARMAVTALQGLNEDAVMGHAYLEQLEEAAPPPTSPAATSQNDWSWLEAALTRFLPSMATWTHDRYSDMPGYATFNSAAGVVARAARLFYSRKNLFEVALAFETPAAARGGSAYPSFEEVLKRRGFSRRGNTYEKRARKRGPLEPLEERVFFVRELQAIGRLYSGATP